MNLTHMLATTKFNCDCLEEGVCCHRAIYLKCVSENQCEADSYHCFFAVYRWTSAFGDNFVYAFFVDGCIAL